MDIPYNVDEIMTAIGDATAEEMRELAYRVTTDLVLGTPVGDPTTWQDPDNAPPGYVGGHARRNWQVGIGRSSRVEVAGEDGSGGITLAAARTVISSYRPRKVLPPIVIYNNAPYIGRLNDGYSAQAPAGFVENALATGVRGTFGSERI